MARRRSGRARRCGPISGARLLPDALIAGAYLAGTNTRRVRRALAALFGGAIGKDTVSRVWRKVKSDWDAWNARSLAEEPIVRLILDGTVVRVRLDRKATSISLLVVLGIREDGQKVLLGIKSTGRLPIRFSAHRYSILAFSPSTKPTSFRPWRNPRRRSARASGDLGSRNPITGIVADCAAATDGRPNADVSRRGPGSTGRIPRTEIDAST